MADYFVYLKDLSALLLYGFIKAGLIYLSYSTLWKMVGAGNQA
jgi:hypothetical protein|tara:strand:- start:1412 stop:1540 length:129 start_codon:yes stop_codon:yes gene_type:complete